MRIEYKKDARYPICYDCGQTILPDDEYYRIGSGSRTRFYHADCFHDYIAFHHLEDDETLPDIHVEIMGEGGAE